MPRLHLPRLYALTAELYVSHGDRTSAGYGRNFSRGELLAMMLVFAPRHDTDPRITAMRQPQEAAAITTPRRGTVPIFRKMVPEEDSHRIMFSVL